MVQNFQDESCFILSTLKGGFSEFLGGGLSFLIPLFQQLCSCFAAETGAGYHVILK